MNDAKTDQKGEESTNLGSPSLLLLLLKVTSKDLQIGGRPLLYPYILGYDLSEGYFCNFPLKPLKIHN